MGWRWDGAAANGQTLTPVDDPHGGQRGREIDQREEEVQREVQRVEEDRAGERRRRKKPGCGRV